MTKKLPALVLAETNIPPSPVRCVASGVSHISNARMIGTITPTLVACLWSFDERDGLYSFAAITDEPPPEIAAAGHDRCIIPIKREHLDAWLNPDHGNLGALNAILDERDRPYYEHRLAA